MALTQQPSDAAAMSERRLPMSYDEFLARDEEAVHAERVGGEIIVFMPPTGRMHGDTPRDGSPPARVFWARAYGQEG